MLVSPLEIGQPNIEAAAARIAALEEYQQAFQQVFGRSPNSPDLGERTEVNTETVRRCSPCEALPIARATRCTFIDADADPHDSRTPLPNSTIFRRAEELHRCRVAGWEAEHAFQAPGSRLGLGTRRKPCRRKVEWAIGASC